MARRIDNPLRLLPRDGSTEGSPVASPRELAAAPVFHHSDAGLRGFESPSRHRRGAGHTVSHDASSHGSRRGSYPGLRREGSFASDTSKLKWDRGSGSNLGTDDDDDEDGLQDPRVDGCALSMAGTLAAAQTSLGPDHNDDEAVRFTAASHRAQFAGSGDVVFTRATMATTTFKRGITWDYGCPLMESDFLAFQNASPLPRVAFALFAMLFALIHWVSRIAARDSPFGDVDCTEAMFVVPVAWAALTLLLEGAMSLYYGRPVEPLPPSGAASDAGADLDAEDRQTSLAHAAALARARVADVWNLLTAVVVPASFLLMDPLRQHTRCALSSTDSFLPVRPHVAPGTDRCAVAPEADLLTVVIFAFFVPLRVRWFPAVAVALVTAALLVELVDFWPAAVGAIYFRRDAGYRGFVVCVYTCEVLFALITAFLKDREARAHFEARVINAQRAFRQRLLAERLRTFALAALPGSLPLDLDPSAECNNCGHGHSHEFTLPPLSTAVPPTFGARALPAGDTCPRGAALHCQVMHLQHLATDTFLRCASKALATPSAVDDDDPGISGRLPSTGSTQQTEGNNSKPAPAVRLRLDPAEDRDSPCNASFLIVQALDLFVQSFDGLARQFGAFRISTLGDGLWAVAGLRAPPSDNPEYALQLCRMARHLHDAVEHARLRLPGGSVLAMRAAIDVGSLAGGICVHACRAQYEASGRSCRVAAAMLRMAPSKGTVVSAAVRAEVRRHFATTEMNTLHLCGERTKMFLLGRGLVVASSHAGNALGHGGLSRSGSTVNSATTTDDEGRARVRSTGCVLDTPLGSVPCTPSQGPIRAHSGPLVPPLAASTVADPPRQPSMSSDALGEPRTAPVSHGPTSMESSRVVAVVTTDDRRQGDAARCPQEAKAAVELRGCGVLSHFADAAAEAAYVEYDLPSFKESRLATPAIHAVLALTLAVGVLVVHSDAVLAVGLTVVAAALCGVLVLLRNTFHGHSLWRFTAYAALWFLPSVCVAVALSVLPGSPMLCAGGYILSLMLIAQFHVVKRTSSRAYCGIFVAHTAAVLLTEAGAHAWLLDTPTVWHTELFVLLEKLLFAIGFFYASTRASRAFFVDEYLTHAAMRRARQEEHKQESMLARLLPPPAAAAVISDILSWEQGQHELLAYGSRDAIVLAVHCSRSETAGYSGESSRGDSVSRLMSASAVSADSVMRSADETSASAEWTWRMNVHHAIDKALAIVSSGTVTLVGREGDTTLLIANCPPWTRDAPCEDMSGLPPLDGFAGALQRLCSISHLLSLELSEAGTTFRIGIHAAPVATAIIGTGRPTFTALGPGTSGAVALSRAAVGDNVAVVSQSTRKAGSVLCARRPFGSVLATIEVEGVGLADLFRLSPTAHRNIMPPAVRPT